MYQCPDVSFFDYSGLDEHQKEKINCILYRNENGSVSLPWSSIHGYGSPLVGAQPPDCASLPPYTIPHSSLQVIPPYPVVLRYPSASPAIVLNPYIPYQFHVPMPQTSGSLAMFVPPSMPPNHISPYHFACPVPPRPVTLEASDPRFPPPVSVSTNGKSVFVDKFQELDIKCSDNLDVNMKDVLVCNCENKENSLRNDEKQTKDVKNSSNNAQQEVDVADSIKVSEAKKEDTKDEKSKAPKEVVQLIANSPVVQEQVKPSWASLLRNTPSANNAIVITSHDSFTKVNIKNKIEERNDSRRNSSASLVTNHNQNTPAVNGDNAKSKLIGFLSSHKIHNKCPSLLPRGLTNRTNWCYVNATLQALLACPAFFHLLTSLSQFDVSIWEALNLPVIKSLVKFVSEFEQLQIKANEKFPGSKGLKQEIKKGLPFEPDFVYSMLQSIDHGAFKLNQQEDAEEFLSCILNKLHEEMVHVMKLDKSADNTTPVTSTIPHEDASWQQVRSKNRIAYSVSPISLESSPVSDIFRGQICSILQCPGQKDSTSLQPFFTLQLDVQGDKIKSVQDALEQFVSKESLVDYTCTQSKAEVDATQRTLIESLPTVLVLHLKWFVYNKDGGIQKNTKPFDLDVNLEFTKDLLSAHAKTRSAVSQRKYKLFAVVNHIGPRAAGGHYTVDIFHPGYNTWLRCDDDNISPIQQQQVLKFTHPKVPYLIFYRRVDATS